MNFIVAISFILIAVAIIDVRAQSCGLITTYKPNVCLFDSKQELNFFDQSAPSNRCEDTNTDPFTPGLGMVLPVNQEACNLLIRQDGKDCIKLYAEFLCSTACTLCIKLPCKKFCDNLASTCPIAAASSLGCFSFMPSCSDSNTACTDWNVDGSKLPSPTSGSSTKASSTAKATSTTATKTHTTTSPSSILTPYNIIFVITFGVLNTIF